MNYHLIAPIKQDYSVIEQILTNRGIKYEDIPQYLHLTENYDLSTELIDNIDVAAKIIIKHLSKGKIWVMVDSDCDGYTSAAVLLNYLHKWVPTAVETNISYSLHTGKQHGINLDLMPEDTTLVIAPDSSSNEYDIHKYLAEKNIDVVVIDHHQAEKVSEYACVVNNQLCDYPNKMLSGVGMVYKLCQHMDKLLNLQNANLFRDIVALGLIADMMDLRSFETSYLIREGLSHIRNPYLFEMIEKNKFSIGSTVTPIGLAFYVAPYVNAITRVGTIEEKLALFESMLEWKAYSLVPSTKRGCKGQQETRLAQAVRYCTNVKNRQTNSQDEGVEKIEKLIAERHLLDKKVLIIKLDVFSVDKGLSGLIANKLMAKYQRPVLILNKTERDNELAWEGSARGYEKSQLKDFRQFIRDSECAYLAEGHPNAFGAGFTEQGLNDFINYSEEELKNIKFEPIYGVDFIFSSNNFKSKDILDIGSLKAFWGQNIEEAKIAVEGIKITKDNLVLMSPDKKPTLKIILPNNVTCIKFKSSQEEFDSLYSDTGCTTINLIGKCENNEYYGLVTPQIIIENYEILDSQEYYF